MARLIFESAEILDNTGSQLSPTQIIKGIVVEGLEQTLTPDTVNLEDNRELYESYTGRIVVRTINTVDSNQDTLLVAGTSNSTIADYISIDGTLPLEGKLRLNGKSGSHDITTATTYIQGHQDFSNGRLEIVLVAQASDVDGTAALVVSAP